MVLTKSVQAVYVHYNPQLFVDLVNGFTQLHQEFPTALQIGRDADYDGKRWVSANTNQ